MIETWVTYFIRKNNDILEVSNLGRLRENGKIIKPTKYDYSPYLYAPSFGTLHRLVARFFIPNPENKPCVDHIDTDTSNNTVTNLRWCTHKENNNNPITLKRNIDRLIKYNKSESHKQAAIQSNKKRWLNGVPLDTHNKMVASQKSVQARRKGQRWMNKDGVSKMIIPCDFEKYINDGWSFGRY